MVFVLDFSLEIAGLRLIVNKKQKNCMFYLFSISLLPKNYHERKV